MRKRTTWITWFAFLGNVLASLAPLAFYFQFEFPENVCQTMVIITFSLMGVSFILAFTYYIQIFKFAKREQAEFEEALAAAQAAIQASHHTASENGTSINGMLVVCFDFHSTNVVCSVIGTSTSTGFDVITH